MADRRSDSPPADTRPAAPDLKQVEAQLARMNKVFMDGADPIVIRDLEGNVLDVNRETERVFGWGRDELLGGRTNHLLTPEFQRLGDETLSRIQQGETVRNVEAAVRTKLGKIVPVLATVFLLKDADGQSVAYAEIVKDITPQKEAAAQLARRNRELQQFANVLAHDLGAPLRSIRRSAEALRQECGDALNDDAREHLDYISSGAERLDCMIDDLLEYARIEHKSATFQPVDFAKALSEARTNLAAAIAESGAEIKNGPLPTIHANRTQIVQLFQNLIGNAIKFRRADAPQIRVAAERMDSEWKFSVYDNGIGIEPRHSEKIFEVFRRLHAENVFPGSGIGLAICKAIVARHGGRIWVESEKGAGSAFHFTIAEPPSNL